jgi:TetR/AcrR family transcriptional regulator, mexXY operon repressor
MLQDLYPDRPQAALPDCERMLRTAVTSLVQAPHLQRLDE